VHHHTDDGPEFIAEAVREWIKTVGAKTAFIEPGSPWENEYRENFNGRMQDELLNGEIFHSLREAQIIIEGWRIHYNTNAPTVLWATAHLRLRPSSRWTKGQSCTSFQIGPLKWGCSAAHCGLPSGEKDQGMIREVLFTTNARVGQHGTLTGIQADPNTSNSGKS